MKRTLLRAWRQLAGYLERSSEVVWEGYLAGAADAIDLERRFARLERQDARRFGFE